MENAVFLGGGGEGYDEKQHLALKFANRHGLIAGATGTGKTITVQILAEEFSKAGVPVFVSDVKGDVSGMAKPGSPTARAHDAFVSRNATIGFDDFAYEEFPVTFWDMFGEQGHPVRATVAEMGPLLLSQILELTEAQEGVLNVVFRLSDEEGLPLLDLKDLRALLAWAGQNARELSLRYGNVAQASIGAIQRRLLVLENQGATGFFGEPALDLADLMRLDGQGRGMINILAADKLMLSPRLYATFHLWLLAELFETLPEVGNPDKPKLVFFFDEAHLLFNGASRPLLARIEQVARLIRSKGVGVYFITQNPTDVPDVVLGQLGNRVQHALRAFTAKDRRSLRQAAETYRENPRFSTEEAILQVGVGEAVTSVLEGRGVPGMVERTLIRPPGTQMGPITPEERAATIARSGLGLKYDTPIDRHSAHEILLERAAAAAAEAEREEQAAAQQARSDETRQLRDVQEMEREYSRARRYDPTPRRSAPPARKTTTTTRRSQTRQPETLGEALGQALIKELGGTTGKQLVRGVLGSLFKGR